MATVTNEQIYVVASLVVAFIVFITCMNVLYYRRRETMTQRERDEQDASGERW